MQNFVCITKCIYAMCIFQLLNSRGCYITKIKGVRKGRAKGAWALPIFGTKTNAYFFTNVQSRFALIVLDSVLGPQRLAQHPWQSSWFSGALQAKLKASWGPLKGTVSAQNALQGSKSISVTRGHWMGHWPPNKSMIFYLSDPPPLCKSPKE